jgi:hypothetical protein
MDALSHRWPDRPRLWPRRALAALQHAALPESTGASMQSDADALAGRLRLLRGSVNARCRELVSRAQALQPGRGAAAVASHDHGAAGSVADVLTAASDYAATRARHMRQMLQRPAAA